MPKAGKEGLASEILGREGLASSCKPIIPAVPTLCYDDTAKVGTGGLRALLHASEVRIKLVTKDTAYV
jgi:hypothetical protein